MIVLDTNYILRFLLNDNNEMFLQAKSVISQQHCLVLNEVIAETLTKLISLDNLDMHEPKTILVEALALYSSKNIDFVDCYLCALKEKYTIKSFDKKLNNCIAC